MRLQVFPNNITDFRDSFQSRGREGEEGALQAEMLLFAVPSPPPPCSQKPEKTSRHPAPQQTLFGRFSLCLCGSVVNRFQKPQAAVPPHSVSRTLCALCLLSALRF